MKEAFRAKNFRPSTLDLIEKCNAIIAEYGGQKITLRQLYYQFIARDLFPDDWIDPAYNAKNGLAPDTKNTEKNYDRLGERVNDARLAGLIDWDAIEDRGRQPVKWREFSGPVAVLDQCIDTYRRPRWEGQQHYVELWCEKDALAGVLAPTAWKHHVTMQVNKGYSSQSAMHEAAQRFRRHAGLKPVLFYLGDHDPSGLDMERDIRARLLMFGVSDVEVRMLALTTAQVRQYDPPPNPAKMTDSRFERYRELHGGSSYEVDALDPPTLVNIVDAAFVDVIDQGALSRVMEREEQDLQQLRQVKARIEERP